MRRSRPSGTTPGPEAPPPGGGGGSLSHEDKRQRVISEQGEQEDHQKHESQQPNRFCPFSVSLPSFCNRHCNRATPPSRPLLKPPFSPHVPQAQRPPPPPPPQVPPPPQQRPVRRFGSGWAQRKPCNGSLAYTHDGWCGHSGGWAYCSQWNASISPRQCPLCTHAGSFSLAQRSAVSCGDRTAHVQTVGATGARF